MKVFLRLTAVLLSILLQNAYGQQPGAIGNAGPGAMGGTGTVMGKVIFARDNTPVEYTSIALYRLKDSTLVSGSISDPEGKFIISDVPFGRYYAEVTFVGYKKSFIPNILVTPGQKEINIGEVKVEEDVQSLAEVKVTGASNRMEYKLDKKVINVSSDLVSSGGTAVDILENTPSVQTDVDGNVQLRGSSNFTVLINGKPSVLQGSEALQQIPATSIQTIEIITNPSAKYDPDGTAGIINVVMKKQKLKGLSGLLSASAANQEQYSSNLLLNFRLNKLNIFAGGDWLDHHYPGSMTNNRQNFYPGDSILYMQNESDNTMHRQGKGIKAGLDYNINDNNSVSFSGNVGNRKFGRFSTTQYHEYWTPVIAPESFTIENNNSDGIRNYYNLTSDYRHTFDDKGHELTASAYYSSGNNENTSDYYEQDASSSWAILSPSETPAIRRQVQSGVENELRTKLDYVKPFSSNSKLEAGYQGRYETSTDTLAVRTYEPDQGKWINDASSYDLTHFSDNIQAVYGTYSNSLPFIDFQVGLRAEYYDRKLVKLLLADSTIHVNRFDLFPSIHLSRKLSNGQQMQLSFSRRVQRPDGHEIDPFPRFFDSLNYMRGNPELQPEFTNSYELNYQKNFKTSFVSIEAYVRQTNNLIAHIQIPEPNNIMRHTFANIDNDMSIGLEMMGNFELYKFWQLNLTATGYHYKINGSAGSQDVSNSSFTGNIRMNSTFSLKTGTKIQLMAMYNAPSVDAQEKEGYMFMSNLGIRQDFLKNKLNATLQIRDMFNTMRRLGTSSGIGWTSTHEFRRKGPVITLTLNYRFNNFKQKIKPGNDMPEQDNNSAGEMF